MSTARRRPKPPEEKPQLGKIVESGFGVIRAELSAVNLSLKRLEKTAKDDAKATQVKLDQIIAMLGEQASQIGQLMGTTARHDRQLHVLTPLDKRDTVRMQALPATPQRSHVSSPPPKRGRPISR